ncbi:MAG: 1-acyl-sn-glycerol-3-phosphate acyltransferase [Eubacteriales bacterium]|nr:1-acyl-sn-glycerol-3-phosphate acyltransferase [Eubacteriales bacterium]
MQGYRRHVRLYTFLRWLLSAPMKWLFCFQTTPVPAVEGPCIVIANHNTDFDSILLGIGYPRHMYFVASEHIFRKEWLRKLLIYFLDPIAKRKGGVDASTALQMVRRLRKGSDIALFAEGNKSFHGATCPVHPATGAMVKASGASMITYKLEGGYFTSPRWAHTLRRGRMKGYPVAVYSPQTLSVLAPQEINRIIQRDIDEDAYQRQGEHPIPFRGKRLAEGIQNALYLCPLCHAFSTVTGKDDQITCGCGLAATYLNTGLLRGARLPFQTLEAWGQWQRERLRGLILASTGGPLFQDREQTLLHIHPDHHTEVAAQGTLSIGRDGLACGDFRLPIVEVEGFEIYGRNTIVFSDGKGDRYQVVSQTERSALKYFEAYAMLREERG